MTHKQRLAFSIMDDFEVARFSAFATEWWNPEGAFRMLHKLHPLRVAYIEKMVCACFGRKVATGCFNKLRVLDAGCGGGMVSESLAVRGAVVTAIDPSRESIEVARAHAVRSGLDIDYRVGFADDLLKSKQRFDVITALEIVEHVDDLPAFLKTLARLLKPNGLLILATVNRTVKSFLFGKVLAEYFLDWVPEGTHDWSKFRRPSELAEALESAGMAVDDVSGVVFDPLTGEFRLDAHKIDINYMMTARKCR